MSDLERERDELRVELDKGQAILDSLEDGMAQLRRERDNWEETAREAYRLNEQAEEILGTRTAPRITREIIEGDSESRIACLRALERIEALERERDKALQIIVKRDGVWIHAVSPHGREALLNLNNIVNEMHEGIIKKTFVEAILKLSKPPETYMDPLITNEQAEEILGTRTAPRITREIIEDKIKVRDFFYQDQLTICVVTMDNGFMVVGKAAPASPENFNAELGEKYAFEDCIKQIFTLEGYRLCEDIAHGRV